MCDMMRTVILSPFVPNKKICCGIQTTAIISQLVPDAAWQVTVGFADNRASLTRFLIVHDNCQTALKIAMPINIALKHVDLVPLVHMHDTLFLHGRLIVPQR